MGFEYLNNRLQPSRFIVRRLELADVEFRQEMVEDSLNRVCLVGSLESILFLVCCGIRENGRRFCGKYTIAFEFNNSFF